jgi:Uma2 family endonuclease
MAISERPGVADGSAPSPWDGQRMTLEEFLSLPEQKPALEYIDGVVRQKVAAKPVHGSIQLFLSDAIGQFARPRRLGVVLPETRFVARRWSPVPDIVFYRRERLRVRRAPDDFTEPPDLAVEIMSPGQTLSGQIQKCLDLVARGTTVAVLVHPGEESVFAFRSDQPLHVLQGEDRIDLDDVLPGFELTVRHLFEAVNWSWLDEEPETNTGAAAETMEQDVGPQADDAATSGRSGG